MQRTVSARVKQYSRQFCSAQTSITALKVAIVVGTILNLINQGDALWGDGTVSGSHLLMNYLVPYLVSSHSFVKAQRLG